MLHRLHVFSWILLLTLHACASGKQMTPDSAIRATQLSLELLDCFEAGLSDDSGKPVFCESSAVQRVGDRLVIANDKYIPGEGHNNVFSVSLSKVNNPKALNSDVQAYGTGLFNQASKIESFAGLPAGGLYFAASAFDRIQTDSRAWDSYNTLFYWEEGKENAPRLLFGTEEDGIYSSKSLRPVFQDILRNWRYPRGVSYFKIEGLTVLPDNSILFGIRETGKDYTQAHETFMLVKASFIKSRDGVIVDPVLEKIYEFEPADAAGIDKTLGISSLEYHEASNSIFIMTTWEEEGQPFETYFWNLPMENLRKGLPPILVLGEDNQPFRLPHKAEGMSFINKKTAFVVCDEDKTASVVKTPGGEKIRQPHQAVYALLRFDW